ncbi:(2Fe-2S)-binding protein [Xanthobacter sp. KR7-225]|uniref:(2Fe-2S)-binding protein n=1 Tax=Xanthobacter sp. KR7-225 TaxID=3156613 RepID=UPI0032B33C88
MHVAFRLNGAEVAVEVDPSAPLLYVLRNDFALNSPKFGCGRAQCGACRVIVEGEAIFSCVTAIGDVAGHSVETLEGIGSLERPHPLQRAFLDEQAAQCGYCSSGMIMAAKVLLDHHPDPSEADIRMALERHLCRCGIYHRIIRAVRRAAGEMTR